MYAQEPVQILIVDDHRDNLLALDFSTVPEPAADVLVPPVRQQRLDVVTHERPEAEARRFEDRPGHPARPAA